MIDGPSLAVGQCRAVHIAGRTKIVGTRFRVPSGAPVLSSCGRQPVAERSDPWATTNVAAILGRPRQDRRPQSCRQAIRNPRSAKRDVQREVEREVRVGCPSRREVEREVRQEVAPPPAGRCHADTERQGRSCPECSHGHGARRETLNSGIRDDRSLSRATPDGNEDGAALRTARKQERLAPTWTSLPSANGRSSRLPEGKPASVCAPDLLFCDDVSGRSPGVPDEPTRRLNGFLRREPAGIRWSAG